MSAAPNFAYELCVRRIRDEDIEGIDLSSWRCALDGAEPVRPDHRAFRSAILEVRVSPGDHDAGVRPGRVLRRPVHPQGPARAEFDRVDRAAFEKGQAAPAAEGDAHANVFVCVGPALPEHEIRVVDEEGQFFPNGWSGASCSAAPP